MKCAGTRLHLHVNCRSFSDFGPGLNVSTHLSHALQYKILCRHDDNNWYTFVKFCLEHVKNELLLCCVSSFRNRGFKKKKPQNTKWQFSQKFWNNFEYISVI
jgi:hypothetical protein